MRTYIRKVWENTKLEASILTLTIVGAEPPQKRGKNEKEKKEGKGRKQRRKERI